MQIISLGRQNYAATLKKQLLLREQRQKNQIKDTVLLVEHAPVITQGRREVPEDYLMEAELLKQAGVEIYKINRGGRLTYHGPGQLVGYFILSLRERQLKVPALVRSLENLMIKTCQRFGVRAEAKPGLPGVWVQDRKIGSIGLSIDRGVSMHGLALNINPNLDHFKYIVPCGIKDCEITSLFKENNTSIAIAEVEVEFKKLIKMTFN